jgi:hypothetical protein
MPVADYARTEQGVKPRAPIGVIQQTSRMNITIIARSMSRRFAGNDVLRGTKIGVRARCLI